MAKVPLTKSDIEVVPVKTDAETERLQTSLETLSELGGKLLGDDDITFGDKFVIPSHLSVEEAGKFLTARATDEEEINRYDRIYNYRPLDGAVATEAAIREAFGFVSGKTLWSFFGRKPPVSIEVEVGPRGEMKRVPWGALKLPGIENGIVHLTSDMSRDYGEVFHIIAEAPRKWRFAIEGLFRLIDRNLRENSIYRSKAIDGDNHFIDTSVIDASKLVYSDSVFRRLEGDLWSFIKYEHQLTEHGQGGKYAVLLEGPWGSGKTEAAGLTAQIATEHGWTFLMARPGRDSFTQALQTARLYPPAVVFAEDIDTRTAAGSIDINESLDMMDGIHAKGQKLIVVFTTNHAERIHKGMLRPGRIGAVIHLGAMDRQSIETLTRRIIPTLEDNVNFDAVAAAMDGYMPAFVREALNRAVRYSIASHDGKPGPVGTTELLDAADSLRDQLALMDNAGTEPAPDSLASAFEREIMKAINGVKGVSVYDDEHQFTLMTDKK